MLKIEELLKKLEGKSPEEQAKMVSNYMSDKRRKQTMEETRKGIREQIFNGCKKLSKAQQEALLYEYMGQNTSYIRNWIKSKHPDLEQR